MLLCRNKRKNKHKAVAALSFFNYKKRKSKLSYGQLQMLGNYVEEKP
jgi:hypothetical protein